MELSHNHPEWFMALFVCFLLVVCASMYLFKTGGGGDGGADFELKCIVSTVDGNKYCVRDRKELLEQEAVDLLARVVVKLERLVSFLHAEFPDETRVQRLVKNFDPQVVMETLPNSVHTAYSENKGEKIAFCLNEEKDETSSPLIDEKTLTFVALHELAHLATESIGHKSEFWENFKFLLENAKRIGIHDPANYKDSPKKYCGMMIHDNPYFDK